MKTFVSLKSIKICTNPVPKPWIANMSTFILQTNA